MFYKIIFACALAVLTSGHSAYGAKYKVDLSHSSVNFAVRHMFSDVVGQFRSFQGTLDFDTKTNQLKSVKIGIDPNSIDTNHKKRDEHLKNADFFNVKKNKTISFKSQKIKSRGKKTFDVSGKLLLNGQTKPVTFVVQYLGEAKDPWGNTKAGFSASTVLKRSDFGVNYNKPWADKTLIGEDVKVRVQLETVQSSN